MNFLSTSYVVLVLLLPRPSETDGVSVLHATPSELRSDKLNFEAYDDVMQFKRLNCIAVLVKRRFLAILCIADFSFMFQPMSVANLANLGNSAINICTPIQLRIKSVDKRYSKDESEVGAEALIFRLIESMRTMY